MAVAAEAQQLRHEGRALALPHQPVEHHQRLQRALHISRRSLSDTASKPYCLQTSRSGLAIVTMNAVAAIDRTQVCRSVLHNSTTSHVPWPVVEQGAPASAWHPATASAACQSRSQRSYPAVHHALHALMLRQHNVAVVVSVQRKEAQAHADGRLCSKHSNTQLACKAHFERVSP